MIIPNIEALSITELRYIAIKHGIDGADLLSQEDLVEALHDFYDEFGRGLPTMSALYSPSSQKRFMTSLVEETSEYEIGELPGVVDLPEIYSETSIHLLLKDPSWAHTYWSVCPSEMEKLTKNNRTVSFFLRVNQCGEDKKVIDSFDISVGNDDISWNVNLIAKGYTYFVSLHYDDSFGESGILCSSNKITTCAGYYYRNPEALVEDENAFHLMFSSLVTKGGIMVDSSPIHEIFDNLDKRGNN